MPPTGRFIPKGVIPAVLLPFDADYAIDEAATRSHLRDVAGVAGISALTVNGHSTEVHACSADEQMRLLDITMDEVGDRVPVVNGIYADGSREAARIARMAEAGGAAALLVLPPHPIGRGNGNARPEMALAHFAAIAEATDLPIIVFQYPRGSGYGYPMATLLRLAETIPSIAAIKDGCNDAKLHDSHVQVLQSLPRPVNVLSTHSPWLMQSLTTGCAGLLSGAGSVIADLQVALFEAIRADDLTAARRINAQIRPTSSCFYADPGCDMHNRMKEALVLLGRLPRAVVRPPLMKLSAEEIGAVERAIAAARLTRDGALLEAA